MTSHISSTLTHVAVLVKSLDRSVKKIQKLGLQTNSFEEFDHEGTRECYIGSPEKSARLLLLEAIKDGPYMRALAKRGPGLHHLGVWIPNLEEYAEQLGNVGWLMHTKSLLTLRKQKTAYFVRPGNPYIVEAWENVAAVGTPSIDQLLIYSIDVNTQSRTKALGISNTIVKVPYENKETILIIEGKEISLGELI